MTSELNRKVRKLPKIVLFICATQFLMGFGCNKNSTRPCLFDGYSFAVTSECSPQKEIYNIGDTIYLTSAFPKKLNDLVNPSLYINYANSIGIGGGLGIGCLDTINRTPISARSSFDFFPITGTIGESLVNPQGLAFKFSEKQDDYVFKCGIIFREKGIYLLSVSNLMSRGLKGKNCTNAGFMMTVTNSEKHLYLHHYALQSDTTDAVLQRTGYVLRVQ